MAYDVSGSGRRITIILKQVLTYCRQRIAQQLFDVFYTLCGDSDIVAIGPDLHVKAYIRASLNEPRTYYAH